MNNEEKKRWYWMGKMPGTRKAVEEYIVLYHKERDRKVSERWKVVKKYDVGYSTLQFHLREVAKLGLYGLYVDEYGIRRKQ